MWYAPAASMGYFYKSNVAGLSVREIFVYETIGYFALIRVDKNKILLEMESLCSSACDNFVGFSILSQQVQLFFRKCI